MRRADVTATAGADYEAVSGVLRFEAGETAKTVSVAVLNDALDEDSETLTLALSAPLRRHACRRHGDGDDRQHGPDATRRGSRASAARWRCRRWTRSASGSAARAGPPAPTWWWAAWSLAAPARAPGCCPARTRTGRPALPASGSPALAEDGYGMSGKELLLGSSFRLGAGGEDGARAWTAWGRFAAGGFAGADDGLTLSGDVTTGFLGADVAQARWLAGLAVGLSEGEGSFDDGAGGSRHGGEQPDQRLPLCPPGPGPRCGPLGPGRCRQRRSQAHRGRRGDGDRPLDAAWGRSACGPRSCRPQRWARRVRH